MLRWVALIGLFACADPAPKVPWRLELTVPERQGTVFEIYVVDGSCMTRPTTAMRTWRRGDPPLSIELSNGDHAIRATAVDETCRVYASGCAELSIPFDDAAGEVLVRLGPTPEIARCEADRCSEAVCAPSDDAGVAADGGPPDAGPFDSGPEPDGCTPTTWFLDGDEDGFGDDARNVSTCVAPPFHVAVGGDCDDNDELANPEAAEVCSGTDRDCDGDVDEGGVCPNCQTFMIRGVRYLGCPAEVGWAQARSTCLENGRDLVTIEDATEDDALRALVLERFGAQQFWIGLHDVDGDGVFTWARSGEEPTYLPWTEIDPDDPPPACVRSTGASTPPGWRDRNCTDPFMFVCDDR
ncbi:MAG: hypothetical protein H6721_19675 [Sandaracinus sp.]|nr:hypothetical protein [Sandaracinus sp.]MCB9622539.1 hypothetical protein [Sandaracinus sp.]MCB9634350.1 hypothetical protein [Sandaracinus sp.]